MTSQGGPSTGPGVETRGDTDRREAAEPDPAAENAQEVRDALVLVLDELRRVQEQLEQLVRIRVDRLKIQWRDRLLAVAWGALGVVVLGTATVAGVLHALDGLAGLIGASVGGRLWLGELVIGAFVLGVVSCGLAIGGLVLRRRGVARLRRSYEEQPASRERGESRS